MKLKNALLAALPYAILLNIMLILMNFSVPQNLLFRLIPIFLLAGYFLLLVFLLLSFKKIKSEFKEIDKKIWISLLLIVLLGFSLRMFVAPQEHRIFFDEDIYLNTAQNIRNELKACMCDYGDTEKCYGCVLNKQPHAYSAFISLFFFFFGVKESVAHTATIILGALSILLVFAAAYFLFGKQSTALYAALIFSLIPEHIRWSATTSLEAFFVFFTLLAVALFLAYFRTASYLVLASAITALAVALQGRPEANLLVILIGLLFMLYSKRLLDDLRSRRFFLLIVLLAVLVLPSAIQLKQVSSDTWGSPGEKFGLDYFGKNAGDNSKFFFENTRFPIIFSVLAIIGFAYSLIKNKKEMLLLSAWFFLFFGIYAVFYAGSFNYGADVRFSLSLYPSVAIFAAAGLGLIEGILSRISINPSFGAIRHYFLKSIIKKRHFALEKPKKKPIGIWIVRMAIIILILVSMAPFIDHIRIYGEEAWDARAVHDFAVKESKKFRELGCYVFSHVSTMFLVNGVNSLQTHLHTNKGIVDEVFKKTDCVIFYEDYWCVNVLAFKDGICRSMHDNFNLTVYSTHTERNKSFTFYTVRKK